MLHLIIIIFTKNWRLTTKVILCAESLFYLFCRNNYPQLLFLASFFRFILESEVHWRGSKICVSGKDSRRATNSFSIYVFFRPSFLLSGYMEKLDLCELLNGRGGEGGSMKICRPADIR